MTKKAVLLTLLTSTLIILIFLPLSYPYKSKREKILSLQRKTLPPEEKTVNVSARVGGPYKITQITGWTSPFAEVTLESFGIAPKKTVANSDGFFVFENINLPEKPNEICLISQDVNQLPSFPLCLPPPPRNNNIEINGVLLSPSLSLEKEKIPKGKTAKAFGTTFPHSTVQVYFFIEKSERSNFLNQFFRSRNSQTKVAGKFPVYEVQSNQNGHFEFSLPATITSKNRLFASAIKYFSDQNKTAASPKSNTLSFQILNFFGTISSLLLSILQKIFTKFRHLSLFLIIIFLEIAIIIASLIYIKRFRKISKHNNNISSSSPN